MSVCEVKIARIERRSETEENEASDETVSRMGTRGPRTLKPCTS